MSSEEKAESEEKFNRMIAWAAFGTIIILNVISLFAGIAIGMLIHVTQ